MFLNQIKILKFILIFLLTLFHFSSWAIKLFQPGQSTRSIGMGGTQIAFAQGSDALFFNAAALSKVEGFDLNLITVGAGASTNTKDIFELLSESDSSIEASDLDQLYGKQIFTDATAYGGLALPYFGVGAYSQNTVLQSFNSPAFPSYNVDFTSDYGYIVAAGIPINSMMSLGVSGRHVKRWAGVIDIPVTDLLGSDTREAIENNLQDRGTGNALDLSMLVSIPSEWNLNLAAVWKDLGTTRFRTTAGNGPQRQEDNLILGAAVQKEIGFMTWTNAFEYKFVRNAGDISKKLHFGTELSLGLFDLRAGYFQGYLSYGAALDLAFLTLDIAGYTAELGSQAGQTDNNRYQAGISLNLEFDQSLKLKTKSGKKRRLQQRR